MKSGSKRRPGLGSGTVSLLVIFTVICMSVLGLLSLSTVASNRRISRRGLDNTVRLAAAEGQAAQKLAELDTALLALPALAKEEYAQQAVTVAQGLGYETDFASRTIWFSQAVSNTTTLFTKVVLLPQSDGSAFQVIEQTLQTSSDWAPAEDNKLWQGS